MQGNEENGQECPDESEKDITGCIKTKTGEQEELATTIRVTGDAASLLRQAATGPTKVALQRSAVPSTPDQFLWPAIKNRTDAISFNRYNEFINRLLCTDEDAGQPAHLPLPGTVSDQEHAEASDLGSPKISDRRTDLSKRPSIYGIDTYNLLKLATEAFLIFETGVVVQPRREPATGSQTMVLVPGLELPEIRFGQNITVEEIRTGLESYLGTQNALPYLDRILNALIGLDPNRRKERLPYCEAVLQYRFTRPSLLELIWSYWHEEGMLVQTMNALSLRFQNRRSAGDRDPLAHLEIDPLRPLNNLLWGYIQDELHRLSVVRRAYEYDHHYGITLHGKAVPALRSADSRSKFLESFHNLLYRAILFFQEDNDTTVVSDGFPLLNALKEVHLILAEGAHNQFGDLPWTARVEMLIMQWLLSRQEIKEFLRGRAMVPYKEPWMAQVDTMKKLQGWTDTTITHFRDLGVFGEQLLLSIRYGDWVDIHDQENAKNWARYWRPEIQSYIHSYLATTGVDLSSEITDTQRAVNRYIQPSLHLQKRLVEQRRRSLPLASTASGTSEIVEYTEFQPPIRSRLIR
jgi:hypothetical protein